MEGEKIKLGQPSSKARRLDPLLVLAMRPLSSKVWVVSSTYWTPGERFKGMDNLWSSFPCYSHCWAMPIEAKHTNGSFIMNPGVICSGSLLAHPACSLKPFFPTRCLCLDRCSCFPDTTCKAIKNLEESLDMVGNPVLARRDADGYYYLGTIIKKVEGEKRTFLVQFTKPFAADSVTCVQPTASSDILEYVNGMKHSILPGDKVMAPWEPEQKRYGPGTVILGIEHRDPLRAKENEEITVSFWNGKKVSVPLGVALWIPPTQWERVVEMIHMPLTSRKSSEGQRHQASCRICSYSPSSEEQHPAKTPMVDHAVNTDSTLFDKPRLKENRRPDWKYWKRSHPSSFYNSQGISIWSTSCGTKRAETSTISCKDRSPTILMNRSAMFETIEQSPRRLLTVKQVLNHEGIKPFSGGG
ncbi:PREDICTED: uncharacterized protein C11orf16 homolog [Gekko japonicus]|uniref:Uncharacterized protein C11orf16 homolog n=1 Tax=Gekko japonicus TaxID=146911 RepID=A0ABM1K8Q0_GEKJA|nr:PREDICTED: uncharacterized protein C11orf16 homolog [Gekko japonicus]